MTAKKTTAKKTIRKTTAKKATTKKATMKKENVSQEDMFKVFEEDHDASGFEDINNSTKSIPFIRILNDLSPQVKKTKPEYIPEAETGMMVNTVSEQVYESPLRVIIGKFERYYIEWKPNRGSFVAAHLPEDIEGNHLGRKLVRNEKFQLIDSNNGNLFTDTYMYYVVLPEHMHEGVCLLSLSSSGIKEAKKLNRNLTSTIIPGTSKRALPYFMIWNLQAVLMTNDQGDWFGPKFTFDSFVTREQLDCIAKERKELPNKTVALKLLSDDREDTGDAVPANTKF